MQGTFYHKIDPLLLGIKVSGNEPLCVIIYTSNQNGAKSVLKSLDAEITNELPLINALCVRTQSGKVLDIAKSPQVRYISGDLPVKTQMNIAAKVTNAEAWHDAGYTGRGVGIAFLDTGIFAHPDFLRPRNRIAGFVDLVNGRTQPYDDNGHGTFVAGVAAGSGYNSRGLYTGIAPGASIVSVKCIDENGNGTSSLVLRGMQYVADNHKKYNIKVVSLSIGAPVFFAGRDDAMIRGAEELWKLGITVIAAAGNEGPAPGTITVPGISPRIITVGAVDDKRTVSTRDDSVPDFSSRGPASNRVKPDIVAPGVDIVSLNYHAQLWSQNRRRNMDSDYTTMTGISVATPMVAGMAALLLERSPEYTPDMVKRQLMQSAQRIRGELLTEGRGIANIQL